MSSKPLQVRDRHLGRSGVWERRQRLAVAALAAALGCWAPSPTAAGQASSAFLVAVALRAAGAFDTGLCRTTGADTAPAATVTVVCDTGDAGAPPIPGGTNPQSAYGGNYRFLTYIDGKEVPGSVDSYAGVGTTTAFRVVSAGGRAYVEMTVGW